MFEVKEMNTKSKYIIGIIVIIVLIAGAVLATGSASSSHIDVVGSTSVQPVAEKLVEVYKESHPDADITVQGGGSSVGIKNANDGTADIGMSSKDVDQKGIFSGEITNWNEVGGSDGEINVVTREEGSGTLDAFESIVMGDKELKDDAIVQSSTEAVKQSVSQDPNAIGFVSYAHMSDDVKSLNVNGVAPSDAAIADGTYELQRPFLFLTNGEPTGDVKEFIDWVLSDEGSKVLAEEKIVKSAS